MRHLHLMGFVVAGALAVAGAAQAAPLNGAALLATAAQESPATVTRVGWDDRRYSRRRDSVRVSSNFRRTVDHGWRTGGFSRRAYPQHSCL
jgi:hypothetical protein